MRRRGGGGRRRGRETESVASKHTGDSVIEGKNNITMMNRNARAAVGHTTCARLDEVPAAPSLPPFLPSLPLPARPHTSTSARAHTHTDTHKQMHTHTHGHFSALPAQNSKHGL